jgi:chemotaxis protein MotB
VAVDFDFVRCSVWRVFCMSVLLIGGGCVGKRRYEEALTQAHQLENRSAEIRSQRDECREQVAKIRKKAEEQKRFLDEAYRQLAESSAEAGALKEDVVRMQKAVEELRQREERAKETLEAFRELVARFQTLIDAGTLRVKVVDGRMIVELATDILFPPGKDSLSSDGRTALATVAGVLSGIERRQYQVAGHTDNVPIKSSKFPSNWHLGAARAIAVTRVLVDGGLSADRLSASSYADMRPADTNRTKEGRARNRRIEIVVVPDLSALPGYEDLRSFSK